MHIADQFQSKIFKLLSINEKKSPSLCYNELYTHKEPPPFPTLHQGSLDYCAKIINGVCWLFSPWQIESYTLYLCASTNSYLSWLDHLHYDHGDRSTASHIIPEDSTQGKKIYHPAISISIACLAFDHFLFLSAFTWKSLYGFAFLFYLLSSSRLASVIKPNIKGKKKS